jgi:hypothetical protein
MMLVDHECEQVDLTARSPGEDQVQAVRFRRRPPLTADAVDLLVGAEGWRSVLCAALNPGYRRPQSRVREIVTSTVLPRLAKQIGGDFIKTVFADRALAFGLLAPSADHVIGFLQYDAERYSPPRGATAADLGRFLRTLLEYAPEPVRTYVEAPISPPLTGPRLTPTCRPAFTAPTRFSSGTPLIPCCPLPARG